MALQAVDLSSGDVRVRLVRLRDARTLEKLLRENRSWLAQWEATFPHQRESVAPSVGELRAAIRSFYGHYRNGTMLPFVVELRGTLVGQLNVSAITHGSLANATLGYWISRDAAGQGVIPTAVALVTDYCFSRLRLHRMEICVRPENAPSLAVVRKLGFRFEGLRRRFIHIDGDWRDHFCFALLAEEVPHGTLSRWQSGDAPEHLALVPEALKREAESPVRLETGS